LAILETTLPTVLTTEATLLAMELVVRLCQCWSFALTLSFLDVFFLLELAGWSSLSVVLAGLFMVISRAQYTHVPFGAISVSSMLASTRMSWHGTSFLFPRRSNFSCRPVPL
jgi:hypothetical protein